jgi:hypothetical protein
MAPDIPKIDPIVIPTLELLRGTSVIRCCVGFFMGNSLSDSVDLLIPFIGKFDRAAENSKGSC